MSKLDELMRAAGGNAAESMGTPRPRPMHGASPVAAPAVPERLRGVVRSRNAAEIPVSKIERDPGQPREEEGFDEAALSRLAESIRTRGVLQPVRVRWDEGRGAYVLICGERRWRAAQLAGLATLPCVIVEGELSPGELLALQLIENALREDLRPIEQARAYRTLMEANGWSTHRLAQELAIDQSSISRALRLLDLPEAVQEHVEQGTLPPATAYEIAKVEDQATREELAARVVAGNLSRSETIEEVRRVAGPKSRSKGKGRGRGSTGSRKPTSRVFRVAGGYRITVENRRGIEPDALRAALAEALGQLDSGPPGDSAAAEGDGPRGIRQEAVDQRLRVSQPTAGPQKVGIAEEFTEEESRPAGAEDGEIADGRSCRRPDDA